MVTTLPILSDIMAGVAQRINLITEAQADSFTTKFEFGPLSEVSKTVYNYEASTVVIWMIEKGEARGRVDLYGNTSVDVIIGAQSNSDWTMQQRMDNNYKPKLLPVYELLITELRRERKLSNPYKIDHKKYNLYYWGGGAINGTNSPNLWERYFDAILRREYFTRHQKQLLTS
jgi:hypothetical protein